MSSRGSKSDGKGSRASGKSERPKVKDGEVVSEVVGDKGSEDVVVVDDTEKTGDGYTCKTCRGTETDDMVQCDQCDGWHHFHCVGVSDEVVDQSWSCANCKTATWNQRTTSTSEKDPATKDGNTEHTSKRALSLKGVSSAGRENTLNGNPPPPKSTDPTVQVTGKKLFVPSVEGLPAIQLDEAASEISCSSSQRSARNRAKLQLQRLEEERAFEEERAERRRVAEQLEAEKHKAFLDKKYQILEELASERGSSRGSISVYSRSRVENWIEKGRNSEAVQRSNEQPAQRELSPPDQLPAQREFDQRQPAAIRMSKYFNPNVQPQSTRIQPALNRITRSLANSTVIEQNHGALGQSCHLQPDDYDVFQLSRSQIAARQAVSKDLPTFSGNPDEWPVFLSMFNSTTAMCGFTEEENLVRLQRSLKGKAYEAVKCRLMHPGNVQGIMSTLKMLFGQPEIIVHSLIRKICSLPPIREDHLETLVDFAVNVQNFCATVDSCGLEEYMYNVSLLHQLVGKLPPSIKLNWAQHRKTQLAVNLATFSEWIYSLAEAASTVTFPTELVQAKPMRNEPRRKGKGETYLNAHSETQIRHDTSFKPPKQSSTAALEKETCPVCKGYCKSVDKCKRFQEFSRESRWAVVREFGLCRTCLRQHKGTCKAKPCGKDGCSFRHHELLHNELKAKSHQSTTAAGNPESSQPTTSGAEQGCNTHQTVSSSVLFRYLPVVLSGPEKTIHTYAFLDEGSGTTLLDQDLADELKLDGTPSPICLRWTGGTERCEKDSCIVRLQVTGRHADAEKFTLEGVQTVNELLLPRQTLDFGELKRSYRYLEGLPIDSYTEARPRILIGTKHAQLGLTLKSREGKFGEPIATKTRLGWTICGNLGFGDAPNMFHYSFHVCSLNERPDDDLHQAMKDYFSIDSLGVNASSKVLLSTEDERAESLLKSLTRFSGDRFETGLLWRYDNIRLPDSRPMALRRHRCLEKRMANDPALAKVLQQKIGDYVTKGYIRKLSDEEIRQQTGEMWYLPVFPVTNPNKPGKVRIVWDAAAKAHGISLNSVLLKGPDLLCSLLGILLRFRLHPVAVTGDIREMFHQVQIRHEDQRYQCFYWTDENGELGVYVMAVMTFGACCSPSSAQYVKNVNADRFKSKFPAACDAVTKSHYVDDMLISVATEEEAIQIAKDVRHVHAQGGFEIRNWISNSRRVVEALQEQNTDEEKSLDLTTELSTEKVLGMWWNTAADAFTYKIGWNRYDGELLKGERRPTKRDVLRVLMTIFDPLGLIAHLLVYLKVLLQDIWRSGVSWDEQIDDEAFEKWRKWLTVLPQVEHLQIPRCFWPEHPVNDADEVQLHTFVDAGRDGMAAVCFLRFSKNEKHYCSLVTAKARVAPLKLTSIPRLELQAAVIGTRLSKTVLDTLPIRITKRFYWSDSRDVLCWISSDHRRYSQYVGFRITEILEVTDPCDWRYVPSKMNVADDATKWDGLPELSTESRWFRGPSFLWLTMDKWPPSFYSKEGTTTEQRTNVLTHQIPPEPIVAVQNFSSWKRLQRVMALVQRFITNCRLRTQHNSINHGPLDSLELRTAEARLIHIAQQEGYPEELRILQNALQQPTESTKLLPKSSPLYKLIPWIDDRGIMRMKTRIAACQFATEDAKNPIILPRKNHITTLIINHYHNCYHHQNHETVINELRQKYQIARLRSCYGKVRRNCQRCKNENAKPNIPIMADLPPGRLAAFCQPFTHVGIDYFGPIEVVNGRKHEKRWGMLATCLTIRAIHIELVHSLSTDSCIMAIRNFIARRGQPRKIYSDRGTNFVGANRELQNLQTTVNHDEIMREFTTTETEWVFNPPLAPHMGGSWERLIRTVKNNLSAVCSTKALTDEVLRNLLIEIENVVNCRPLTHVPVDDDSGPALTPNHFLVGSSNGTKPLVNIDDSGYALKQNMCTSQILANTFWKRWVTDYLPEITRRSKWFQSTRPIATGDIVVIVDPKLPRNCWPKGRVISTKEGRDSQIRSATVQTISGVYERPVAKLAILDVQRVE
ncbi:uncharacterized protein LOC109433030 [Aedes albopictus]|uniref:Uncharacterized protein n=1 Tax=Aedes albopictus TaxID=7160 RepID=A0ABM1ZHT5_AEDAL